MIRRTYPYSQGPAFRLPSPAERRSHFHVYDSRYHASSACFTPGLTSALEGLYTDPEAHKSGLGSHSHIALTLPCRPLLRGVNATVGSIPCHESKLKSIST